jgi:hypothetical protein
VIILLLRVAQTSKIYYKKISTGTISRIYTIGRYLPVGLRVFWATRGRRTAIIKRMKPFIKWVGQLYELNNHIILKRSTINPQITRVELDVVNDLSLWLRLNNQDFILSYWFVYKSKCELSISIQWIRLADYTDCKNYWLRKSNVCWP